MVAQKLALLVFSFALGRAGGAPALGVMATVLALVWVLTTLAGMGLPDRMTFVAAAAKEEGGLPGPEEARLHGTYWLHLCVLTLVLIPWAPELGGADGPGMETLACGLVLGAGLHGLAAPTFCACRGMGRPAWEGVGLVLMAIALPMGLFLDDVASLGLLWAATGATQAVVALLAAWRTPGLGISLPASPARLLRAGLPYLGYGVGAWLVGNVDVLLARVLNPAGPIGQLQVGTMAVRAVGSGAWVMAILSLHKLGRRDSLPWRRLGLMGAGLSLVGGLGAWVVMPLLAWGHGLEPSEITDATRVAALCAPTTMVTMLLLPLGGARCLAWTLRCIGLGLVTAGTLAWLGPLHLGVADCIVAAAGGQVVVAVGLVLGLRAKNGEVRTGATSPGVVPGGLGGQGTSVQQGLPVQADQAADALDERGGPAGGV
jgi:hypothetical protein